MATVNVDVDIELDEFTTIELIDELEDRIKLQRTGLKGFRDRERARAVKMLNKLKYGEIAPESTKGGVSLLDQMKVEVLIEARDKYSLEQLKSLLHL